MKEGGLRVEEVGGTSMNFVLVRAWPVATDDEMKSGFTCSTMSYQFEYQVLSVLL
jgi:hypothetical protein